jgi:hypothetical protein
MTTEPEGEDLVRRREATKLRPRGVIYPETIEESMRLCDLLAQSELVPTEFRSKPANIFVALQMGADLGLSPMQALQSIAVFNGKPGLYGDVGLALAQKSGELEDFEEWFDEETNTAHCRARRIGGKDVERSFGMIDADRIQVYEKGEWKKLASRQMYVSYPRRMYQMRARWWCLRDTIPGVFKGIAGREELEEHTGEPREPKNMGPAIVVERDNPFMPREVAAQESGNDHVQATSTESAPSSVGDSPAAVDTPGTPPPADRTGAPVPVVPSSTPAHPAAVAEAPGDRTTLFELNGQRFATCGVTKDQMLELFRLCPQVDKKKNRGFAKKLLVDEFKVQTRSDLTNETAEQYSVRLREVLEG